MNSSEISANPNITTLIDASHPTESLLVVAAAYDALVVYCAEGEHPAAIDPTDYGFPASTKEKWDAAMRHSLAEYALRTLLYEPPDGRTTSDDFATVTEVGYACPPLLRACTKLLNSIPRGRKIGIGFTDDLVKVRIRLHSSLCHGSAEVRGAAIELLQSLHSHSCCWWILSASNRF